MNSTTVPVTLALPADLAFAFSRDAWAAHLPTVPDQRHARGGRYPRAPMRTLAVLAQLTGPSRLEARAAGATRRAADQARLRGLPRARLPHPRPWSRSLGPAGDPVARAPPRTRGGAPPPPVDPPARGSVIRAGAGQPRRGTMPLGPPAGVQLGAADGPAPGVGLAHLAGAQHAKERVGVRPRLAHLDVAGTVVVGAALPTQRALRIQLVEPGGA